MELIASKEKYYPNGQMTTTKSYSNGLKIISGIMGFMILHKNKEVIRVTRPASDFKWVPSRK